MSDAEYELLSPVPGNQREVRCNKCDKPMPKRSLFKHLAAYHPELEAESWNWCIKGDYNLVKQQKLVGEYSVFNVAWFRKAEQENPFISALASDPPDEDPFSQEQFENTIGQVTQTPMELDENQHEEDADILSVPPTPTLADLASEPPASTLQLIPAIASNLDASEGRIVAKIDQVVDTFNEILMAGLGEVSAKYDVALPDWFTEFDIQVNGKNFPNNLLSNNYSIEMFKITILEFRGLNVKTASDIIRDVSRFFGCFVFSNEAGKDIANLVVSIFKHGLLKTLLLSKLWNAKANYLRSLKWSLKHLVDYLENEERILRSFGGLTTALNTIGKALDYEMSAMVKNKEAQRRSRKAQKDTKLIQDWVGSEVYKEMVLKAFQGLRYIYEHKDDDGFWNKWTHYLATQFLVVIVCLNTYPGRCGGWELIERDDMMAQLAGELIQKNILVFLKHKTDEVYGPLKKWVPNNVIQALKWYSQLPLGESKYFITAHSKGGDMVYMSHILHCACITLGHPGACPGTNFLRKLYHTYTSAEGGNLGDKFNNDLKDLAEIDAHSEAMANSLFYDLSDMVEGPLIKKSIRAFWTLNKKMPVAIPDEVLTEENWNELVANMGKRGKQIKKRPAAEAQLDEAEEQEDEDGADDNGEFPRPLWSKQAKYRKIQAYGKELLEWCGADRYKNWMFHTMVQDVWNNEGLDTSYLQVRYVLLGK